MHQIALAVDAIPDDAQRCQFVAMEACFLGHPVQADPQSQQEDEKDASPLEPYVAPFGAE